MRLPKRQVKKLAVALPQNPTARTHFNPRRWGDKERCRTEGLRPPLSCSHLSLVVEDPVVRAVSEDAIVRKRYAQGDGNSQLLTHTSPLVVIIASIVPFRTYHKP